MSEYLAASVPPAYLARPMEHWDVSAEEVPSFVGEERNSKVGFCSWLCGAVRCGAVDRIPIVHEGNPRFCSLFFFFSHLCLCPVRLDLIERI